MGKVRSHTEGDNYIEAILNNDSLVIQKMYETLLPSINQLVQKNNGNIEDAQDVLQDGLMIIFDKISQPSFELTSSFNTYLYSICRFVWWRKLKKKHRKDVTIEGQEGLIEEDDIEATLMKEEKWQLFRQYFSQLGAECQRVLKLFFEGEKMATIAQKMNYTERFAKTKKYLCKQKLMKAIQKDRVYKELL